MLICRNQINTTDQFLEIDFGGIMFTKVDVVYSTLGRKMRTSIAIAFAIAFFSISAGCQERTLSPYEFGVLVRENGCKAAEQVAMRQADPDLYLAIMYDRGLCRKQDNAQALAHYLQSAKRGNDESMYSVFLRIAKKGSPEHPQTDEEVKLAQHWLVKAGEKNNWRAAHVLQLCHEVGCWGLPIDLEKSKHYKAVMEKYGPNQSSTRDAQHQASPEVGAR